MWQLRLSNRAKKQLAKIDAGQRRIIEAWLRKNVDGCENPRAHGRALVGNHAGQWRYRIGSYRVICHIEDDSLVVLAVEIGHRSGVY